MKLERLFDWADVEHDKEYIADIVSELYNMATVVSRTRRYLALYGTVARREGEEPQDDFVKQFSEQAAAAIVRIHKARVYLRELVLENIPAVKRTDAENFLKNYGTEDADIKEVEQIWIDNFTHLFAELYEEFVCTKEVCRCFDMMDISALKGIAAAARKHDPAILQAICTRNFSFEDIQYLDDIVIQKMLSEVDHQHLAMSLLTADDKVKQKIFSNMSSRAASMLQEDMERMCPEYWEWQNIERFQQEIVELVCRFAKNGESTFPRLCLRFEEVAEMIKKGKQ